MYSPLMALPTNMLHMLKKPKKTNVGFVALNNFLSC